MDQTKILIVDDELVIRESLSGWLERDGYLITTASSGEKAIEILKKKNFNILLVDIKMDGISGMDVLKHVKTHYPDIEVIMITAFGSIPSAVQAMRLEAFDYLLKPFDPEELGLLIEKVIDHQNTKKENLYLKEEYNQRTRFESMIGQSKPMQEIFNLIEDIRDTDSTVLITGETGTGKG
ncbi:MAG: response regulator, partial [Desulfobacteraceae bacterium]|nr:response regulator [Desulfobacteraceae bacterium]